jgi:hypothetical protein
MGDQLMAKHEAVPPGHVLIRIEDLAWLLATARPPGTGQPVQPSPPAGPPGGAGAFQALAIAIALLTKRLGGSGVSDADLVGDTDPATVISALASVAARAMACAYPLPVVQAILRDLGVAVAREATRE